MPFLTFVIWNTFYLKFFHYILCNNICILILGTVGENIIATTKIQNNYGAILSLIFPILRKQY